MRKILIIGGLTIGQSVVLLSDSTELLMEAYVASDYQPIDTSYPDDFHSDYTFVLNDYLYTEHIEEHDKTFFYVPLTLGKTFAGFKTRPRRKWSRR